MSDKIEHSKVKMTVLEVKPRQEVTFKKDGKTAPKLVFKAKEGEKTWMYSTFAKDLFETIEGAIGKELECDYEESEWQSQDGPMTDRKITQIYVDGNPLAKKGKGGSYSRGGYGQESPEKMASIESQTAFQGIIELLKAKVIELDHAVAKEALKWAMKKLTAVVVPTPAPAKAKESAPKAAAKTQAAAPNVPQAEKEAEELWPKEQPAQSVNPENLHATKAYIQDKMHFKNIDTVDKWLVSQGFPLVGFNADPAGQLEQVKNLMGWT